MSKPNKDLWENDPSLVPKTPQHLSMVKLTRFQMLESRGVEPGDSQLEASTQEFRKEYLSWWTSRQGA
jgi:hypothetical protein